MYKLLIIITLSCLFAGPATAQNSYRPMLGQSTEWLVQNCYDSSSCLYDYYIATGDTIHHGKTYKVLDYFHFNKNFFLREDTLSRRVYFKMYSSDPKEPEYLLYDFSLLPGDTMEVQNPYSPAAAHNGPYRLDSIVPRNFQNISRRVFYLSALDSSSIYPHTYWIEGIGATSLINTPAVIGNALTLVELQCAHQNNQKIYLLPGSDTCYTASLGIVTTTNEQPRIDFLPQGLLKFQNLPRPARFYCYTNAGQLLWQYSAHMLAGEQKIEGLSQGLYVLLVVDENGSFIASKWIVKN